MSQGGGERLASTAISGIVSWGAVLVGQGSWRPPMRAGMKKGTRGALDDIGVDYSSMERSRALMPTLARVLASTFLTMTAA